MMIRRIIFIIIFFITLIIFMIIIIITIFIIIVICSGPFMFWKIFEKAGEKCWKSIIPFYNIYILYKISCDDTKGSKKVIILFLLWFIVEIIGYELHKIPNQYERSLADIVLFMPFMFFLAIVGVPTIIFVSIFYIRLSINVAKAFGKRIDCAMGCLLFPIIFYPILGYGDAKYIWNKK